MVENNSTTEEVVVIHWYPFCTESRNGEVHQVGTVIEGKQNCRWCVEHQKFMQDYYG